MTFSVLEDDNKLNHIATDLSAQLKALTDALVAQGKHVTILVTEQDDRGEFEYAVVSTIDDHEELMTMVDDVSSDLLAPYVEVDEDDQPELPFKTETIQ
ncbi:hypothetical protein G6L26_009740 [Agrobacterium radiobacter]|uniref:hypothetical protein n=1 Tax=Agrobacterium tumefaciens complex TaxID=1183400 RepID=UPI00080FB79E|nr:hypothetical protein [Agrobacterium tumefaciens]NTA05467.1 hypothetical protein [Agrobacterium tumefaciens]NTA92060.1 hypothetical protein [Agrobacterium tumefaciens]OCJ32216.1 hypothetical protein A6U90_09890 [Agrobacterium tumefaciens]